MAYKQKGFPKHGPIQKSPAKLVDDRTSEAGDVSKSTLEGAGKGALSGAATGASIGSVVPGIGTAVGAAVGAVIGGVGGAIMGNKGAKEAIVEGKEQRRVAAAHERTRKRAEAAEDARRSDEENVAATKILGGATPPKTTSVQSQPMQLERLYSPTKKSNIKKMDKKELKKVNVPSSIKKMSATQATNNSLFEKMAMDLGSPIINESMTEVAITPGTNPTDPTIINEDKI